eukprot:6195729-Pleurochrysis_carterae.AAC.1
MRRGSREPRLVGSRQYESERSQSLPPWTPSPLLGGASCTFWAASSTFECADSTFVPASSTPGSASRVADSWAKRLGSTAWTQLWRQRWSVARAKRPDERRNASESMPSSASNWAGTALSEASSDAPMETGHKRSRRRRH